MAADISLLINNRLYGGWVAASVDLSIENLAGNFNLAITDKWAGQANAVVIKPTDSCVLYIDNEVIITGYVDIVNITFDSNNHTIQIIGRDKTADLIDCAIINGTGQYTNLKLEQIITRLCEPFGIKVTAAVNTGDVFDTFNVEQGSTVYENMYKLCTSRQCLAMSDGKGGVLITRAGSEQAQSGLIEGSNILAGNVSYDNSQRYSQYYVKGQQQGSDTLDVDSIAGNLAIATDSGVVRYRPLVVVADGQASKQDCVSRANWELNTRIGRSRRFSISVVGWQQENGSIWKVNQLVFTRSDALGVYDQLLIAGINFSMDENGQIATLTLTPQDAYLTLQTSAVDIASNPYLTVDDNDAG